MTIQIRGERIAIYTGDGLAPALVGFEHGRSARVNQIAASYLMIVADECPELTLGEWSAVVDVLNGADHAAERNLRFVWASIADADKLDGLGAKWGIDAQALAQRVRDMRLAQLIALTEIGQRYWNLSGGVEHEIALKQAGAKVRAYSGPVAGSQSCRGHASGSVSAPSNYIEPN
jgi:hypothetical protein